MPTDPLIDVEALAAPLPGDNPGGEPIGYAARRKLEEQRKTVRPTEEAPDIARDPDWEAIVETTTTALAETSKDLMLACRLTEALTQLHGFAGLRDGLNLLRAMAETGWDYVLPEPEGDDHEPRAGPLRWLDDADRGSLFPHKVRAVPIIGAIGWRAWRDSLDEAPGAPTSDDVDQALASAPEGRGADCVDELTAARGHLDALGAALDERLGAAAPPLSGLREAINQCLDLAEFVAAKQPPREGGDSEPAKAAGDEPDFGRGGGDDTGGDPRPPAWRPAAPPPGAAPAGRDDILQKLGELTEQLAALEPGSPAPYMLRRALKFAAMPFPEMLKNLMRNDAAVADVLDRDLDTTMPE